MSHRRTVLALVGLVAALVPLGAPPASAAGTVTVAVTGQGSATGSGISCTQNGGDCSEFYADTSHQECDPELKPPCHTVTESPIVTLTAGPDSNGFVYDGWLGCDSVAGRDCTLDVSSSKAVTARFRDAQAPTVGLPVPNSGESRRGMVLLQAAPSDNSGSLAKMEFRVRGVLVGTDTTVPYETSFDSSAFADGAATLEARAYDAAGNAGSSTSSFTIDNTAPELAVSGPDGQTFGPGSTQLWSLTATDATSSVSVQCSVVPAGQPASFGLCSGGSASHSVTDLGGGSYDFVAQATDAAGNTTTAAERSFTIDATSPTTTIRSGPASVVKIRRRTTTSAFVLRSSEAGSTFRCKLDRKVWKACGAKPSFTVGLGKHVLRVAATDAFGNRDATPATWTWTVKKRS